MDSDETGLWARLRNAFTPSSIALVGASDDSGWSRTVLRQWTGYGPRLAVYCVNPSRTVVHDRRAYRSLQAIDAPVDLAYVMTSAARVTSVLTEAADAGIRSAVVLTGGFAEAGAEGSKRQAELRAICNERDMTVLGPNCNGFANVTDMRVVYGGPLLPPLVGGKVAIVSQSGAIATRILAMAQLRAIGLSMVVTVGNEAALSATTVMRYLVRDPQTSVITAFLEAISDADEFRLAMTEAAAAGKPVVLLKVGRSEASRSAALDHTGAMTGDDDVVTTALSQLGVIRVRSLEDLIVTAGYLAKAPTGAGRRLAVVGASGGAGEIVADRAVDEGLELPALSEGTRTKLSEFLPEGATIGNPLDVTGRVVLDPELLTKAVETVRADSQMESVVVYTTLPRFPPDDSSALRTFFETLSKLNDEPGLPISVIAHGGADLSQFPDVVSAHRLPIFDNIEHAVIALGNAAWWQAVLARASVRPDANPRPRTPAAAAGEGSWGEWRARALLGEHGIPVTPGRLVHSAADAARVAQELATTVVAKAISDELLHKSDVGGVVLDIATPDDAGRAYEQIVSSVSKKRPDVVLDGVMIAPMRTGGVEVLVSVSTDAQWGKVLTVGLGGIWVELLADVSRRVLPVDAIEVEAMLAELRGARLLSGSRGQTPHDIAGLARVIHDIAAVGAGFGAGLLTLEVNPLWIRGTEVEVLDALVIWSSSVADSG